MMNDKPRRCADCEHIDTWVEHGDVLQDCGNPKAETFIGSLDGVEDPAAAGCPFFERAKEETSDE